MNQTTKVVSDGVKRKLPAELLGQIEIKKNEIVRRIEEGTLPLNQTLTGLQAVVEGRVKPRAQLGNNEWDDHAWEQFKQQVLIRLEPYGLCKHITTEDVLEVVLAELKNRRVSLPLL